jgi:hypothetical protein
MPTASSHRIAVVVTLAAATALPARVRAQDVRVTVLAILATDRNSTVDPRLKDLAAEVKKREPSLTGFTVGPTASKEISVGQKEAIELIKDKAAADVKVLAKDDSKKRVTLEVKPPMGGAFIYQTTYDKYFPYVTREVVNGERLIIAVMVKPAGGDKPPKP